MSVVLEYNTENKILYLTIIDELNVNELTDALNKITHSDEYPHDVGILLDVTSINMSINNMQFHFNSIDIKKLFLEKEKAKIAIITNDYPFGKRKKYEMLSETEPHNIMIFNNFIEAEEWLK